MLTEAANTTTTFGAQPHLLTTYAENGEVDLVKVGDRFVLSACEERSCGYNRVHARKVILHLTRRDVADLRRVIDYLLRDSPRPGRWSDSALTAMAQEFAT